MNAMPTSPPRRDAVLVGPAIFLNYFFFNIQLIVTKHLGGYVHRAAQENTLSAWEHLLTISYRVLHVNKWLSKTLTVQIKQN